MTFSSRRRGRSPRRALARLAHLLVSLAFGAAVLAFAPTARAQFDDPLGPGDSDDSATAKELELTNVPDEPVFLRAIADKPKAYVGEQVTLSVYLYFRVAYEMSERHDPKYADFLRYPLLLDPGSTAPVYTRVNGKKYGARLVERVALVPLKAGKLPTGPMSARFKGREIGARVLKSSNDTIVDVEEPPKDGRPANYVIGDVGQFAISATVAPRKTYQGGSVSVTVKVEGTGNVPAGVTPPSVPGVKWLTPRRKESISAKQSKIGGSRTFEYVVRIEKSGSVNLGTVELSYFDPVAKKYETTKAELGSVDVEARNLPKSLTAPDDADAELQGTDPLKELPRPRTALGAFRPEQPLEIGLPLFLGGLAVPPILAIALMLLGRARGAIAERRGTAEVQLRGKMKTAMKEAAKADKANDPRAACAALEKALHAALETRTGIKTRALRLDEVVPRITEAGVDKPVAEEAKEVLSQCEELRFMPTVDEEAFEGLRKRAQSVTKKLSA